MDKRLFFSTWLCLLAASSSLLAGFSQVSTAFRENRGQISSAAIPSSNSILFYAQLGKMNVFIHPDGLSLVSYQNGAVHRGTVRFSKSLTSPLPTADSWIPEAPVYHSACPASPIRSCSSLTFHTIQPDLDLHCSLENGALRLEFVPTSNAKLAKSQNSLETSQSWDAMSLRSLNTDHLMVYTDEGSPLCPLTVSNAESFHIEGFANNGNSQKTERLFGSSFSVNLNSSESAPLSEMPSQPVISATLDLSSYLGGSGADSSSSGTGSGDGMVLCGATSSPNFPTSTGSQQTSLSGPRDAFVTRFDASGHRLWSTYFGGSGDDIALGCYHTGSKVYVCGRSSSTSIATSGSLQSSYGGGAADAFVGVFDESNGKLQACTYYGGSEWDEARSICVLPSGSVAVAGTTYSSSLTMNGQQTSFNAPSDAFALVLQPNLNAAVWSTYYGGRTLEEGRAIGCLSDGSVILAGNTSSPNSGALIAANVGEGSTPPGGQQTSGFLVRFDSKGMRTWGRYVGGEHYDTLTCMAVVKDNIYLGGFTNSSAGSNNNFMSGGTAQASFAGGNSDAFVCRINPDGARAWGSYLGGSGDDRCLGICTTESLEVLVSGTTTSADFPQTPADEQKLKGASDAFVAFFLRDGSKHVASMLVGGSGDDYACAVAQQADGSILLAGSTSSSDFASKDASQASYGGSLDAFVQRYEALYVVNVEQSGEPTPQVWPNPCSNVLNLNFSAEAPGSDSHLRILDLQGRCLHTAKFDAHSGTQSISTQELVNGVYVLQIVSAEKTQNFMFSKVTP